MIPPAPTSDPLNRDRAQVRPADAGHIRCHIAFATIAVRCNWTRSRLPCPLFPLTSCCRRFRSRRHRTTMWPAPLRQRKRGRLHWPSISGSRYSSSCSFLDCPVCGRHWAVPAASCLDERYSNTRRPRRRRSPWGWRRQFRSRPRPGRHDEGEPARRSLRGMPLTDMAFWMLMDVHLRPRLAKRFRSSRIGLCPQSVARRIRPGPLTSVVRTDVANRSDHGRNEPHRVPAYRWSRAGVAGAG